MSLIAIDKNPSIRTLRQFACIFFPAFCGVVGAVVMRKGMAPTAAWILWSVGAIVLLVGLIAPKAIKPLFLGLMYVTFPIGWVVSHVLLLIAFYLVLTPIGLLMRLFGYDPMQRKLDSAKSSYWIARAPNRDVNRYFKQY